MIPMPAAINSTGHSQMNRHHTFQPITPVVLPNSTRPNATLTRPSNKRFTFQPSRPGVTAWITPAATMISGQSIQKETPGRAWPASTAMPNTTSTRPIHRAPLPPRSSRRSCLRRRRSSRASSTGGAGGGGAPVHGSCAGGGGPAGGPPVGVAVPASVGLHPGGGGGGAAGPGLGGRFAWSPWFVSSLIAAISLHG